ncbi:MAG: DUF3795 domain-containing protein [Clostridiaceae bacterium]
MTDNYEIAKQRLGPCGLHCGKCFAYANGDIHDLSKQLEKALGNFDIYAERFGDMLGEPVFSKYPGFKEFLHYLTIANCQGCRKEKCKLFKTCGVRPCSEKNDVDFCFQCDNFPCEHTGFDEHLQNRHIAINNRMKEIGVEKYYDEVKDQSRY